MSEREKFNKLIGKVKYRIQALDEIEANLFEIQNLVMKSTEDNVLNAERRVIQKEIDELIEEIGFIDMKSRIKEDLAWT